jgi:hypothetical protein
VVTVCLSNLQICYISWLVEYINVGEIVFSVLHFKLKSFGFRLQKICIYLWMVWILPKTVLPACRSSWCCAGCVVLYIWCMFRLAGRPGAVQAVSYCISSVCFGLQVVLVLCRLCRTVYLVSVLACRSFWCCAGCDRSTPSHTAANRRHRCLEWSPSPWHFPHLVSMRYASSPTCLLPVSTSTSG